jgi:hypothetical protein
VKLLDEERKETILPSSGSDQDLKYSEVPPCTKPGSTHPGDNPGQVDGFFSQIPYKCHQIKTASVVEEQLRGVERVE